VRASSLEWPITNTDHGVLVAFGEFLQKYGLLERLRHCRCLRRQAFRPPDKLIELLAGILSGIHDFQDLNYGLRPRVKDTRPHRRGRGTLCPLYDGGALPGGV
jgi:hypothetical protein